MVLNNRISDAELLRFAVDNGILDRTTIEHKIEMANKQKYLEMHNIKFYYDEEFLDSIVKKALDRKTGARGLKSAVSDAFDSLDYNLDFDIDLCSFIIYKVYISIMFEWKNKINEEEVIKNITKILETGLLN